MSGRDDVPVVVRGVAVTFHADDAHAAAGAPEVIGAPAEEQLGRRFEIRCHVCSFGGIVVRLPERCPICGGYAWEAAVEAANRRVRAGVSNGCDLDEA